jgi:uncharacterized membrane protein YeaQ/YmgE (transglycosylase-associated protein family)
MSGNVYLHSSASPSRPPSNCSCEEPIKDLWVRDGSNLSLSAVNLWLALPLAIVPLYHLIAGVAKGQGIGVILNAIAAIVGAGAAAYALAQFEQQKWIYLGLCVATASLIGTLLTVDAAWHDASAVHPTGVRLRPNALFSIESLLHYVPALFMIEEVAFRGAIDAHVRHPGGRRSLPSTIYGIVSAILVSVLLGSGIIRLCPKRVCAAAGDPGRDGTVPLPLLAQVREPHGARFAHALSDSVRNALGLIP